MHFVKGDFTTEETKKNIFETLKQAKPDVAEKPFDAILSDMAPNYTGQKESDHANLIVCDSFFDCLLSRKLI